MTHPLSEQVPPLTTRKEARARVMAENASRRAARSWFRKKRFLMPIALVVLIVIIQVVSG